MPVLFADTLVIWVSKLLFYKGFSKLLEYMYTVPNLLPIFIESGVDVIVVKLKYFLTVLIICNLRVSH